ncbi:DEAD/DEAH box helicase [Flammeovirga kamogawensis]|uniref:DEAD/DEAH box helicase n=1 Tax=Flammeovirga kamogawensis TaxID=373891 RepID=A0ABX8GZA6_9BACT|nr:DEAD/DEAH box helicase [Flammeovirga kamogawensis]MBB6459184.1 ATP-dependent RNA helicase RhlE [Flammeovirga kamogawensis]QWG08749.1 DEAD/DEAH box helicase [Flammeovirga kamogawensis]TRX67042.1 DEAD/DEAH box helicase [Flammeovirga kamogawensis]
MKFEKYNISVSLKKSLAEKGFKKPTDIQFKSIPPILKGEDVLAIAQTGTGKTAAFAIPIMETLLKKPYKGKNKKNIRCLVMAPTRELAIQITEVFKSLGQYTKLNILCIYGGVEQESQIKQLNDGVDILIATPGRMFDLNHQGHVDLSKTEILVLDEADHMLEKGFLKDIKDVIRLLPKYRQTLFFSATIDEAIKKLAYSLVRNAIRIQISPKDPVSKNVRHGVGFVDMDDKRFFLEKIAKEHPDEKILVFVRTQVRAERVFKAMERVDLKTVTIHGGKDQKERAEAMRLYKTGEVKILIATDVSARGIDIPNVQYVINYDMPDVPENYVHRVGRTGRGVEKGDAISFCSDGEKELLQEIEEFMDKKIAVVEIARGDYANIVGFSEQKSTDWKTVMKEIAHDKEEYKKIKSKAVRKKAKKKAKKK